MKRFFPQILKELRQEHNLTQTELAYNLKYTQSNVSEWEKGTVEPKATALTIIANYFGVSADFLLGLEDDFGSRTVAPSSAPTASSLALTQEESKVLEQYRNLPEKLRKLVRQQLDVYNSSEELLFKPDKKV